MSSWQGWRSLARARAPVAAALLLGLCVPMVSLAQPVSGPPGYADAAPAVPMYDGVPFEPRDGPPVIAAIPIADDLGRPGVPWSSLSPQQRQLLGPLQGRWDSLPPGRQRALARGADRWISMTPEQRAAARARLRTWQRLNQPQRAFIRRRFQQFENLSPDQQRSIQQYFHEFSSLPPAQREQLRQRWLNATPQERAQMLQRQRQMRGPGSTAPRGQERFGGRRFGGFGRSRR